MSLKPRAAFTLIELSMVLVIIALITGGVFAGQTLVRSSEMRSIVTQYTTYVSSVNAFRDKYGALPGDMPNATTYWGAAHATPATCYSTIGTGTQTCNGDGDNRIFATGAAGHENFRLWQQLVNAGYITGKFSGVQVGGVWGSDTTNSPSGKMTNSLWFAHNWDVRTNASAIRFEGVYHNFLMHGAYNGDFPGSPLMTPTEVWSIDKKLDDGLPAQGMVVPVGTLTLCTTATLSSDLSADYSKTTNTKECAVLFRQVY